ncbi:MAG TPA: YHS domain-containing protein [Blastocatellia bacterium]|nr:YHS domain-containing protein [Blastocatellia bacterium]
MRRIAVLFFILTMSVAAAFAAQDDTNKPVTNRMCPVMNAAVSPKYRTEYKGQYVYFCCQGCVKMFEKEPETYIAKLSAADKEAIKTNEICPVTNDKITDQTRFVEHEGRKVYFCCDGCVDMFKKKIAEAPKKDN